MTLETDEVGIVIKTPGFRGNYQPHVFDNDHIFEATLKVSENLSDQIGNGSLVIEVEVDLIKDEGFSEEVQISRGGPKVFTFHSDEPKSWYEAEAFCQKQFYLVLLMDFLTMFPLYYLASVFKTMGMQLGHIDDVFLTWIGSLGALANGGSRIFWGPVYDKTGYRLIYMIVLAIESTV